MSTPNPPMTDGKIDFVYKGETFQTYYKVYGDLSNTSRIPLVVLHGGPGLTHDYLAPFADLATALNIPVIMYDQLGNGRSTHLKHKPATFWSIDLFVAELLNLLQRLVVYNAFDLVGHSWGGILASEFEVREHPAGLRHLVISDSLAAQSLWNKSNAQLVQAFPNEVKEGLLLGMKDREKFWNALQKFYAVHGCRVQPFPKEFLVTMEQVFGPDGDHSVASAPILKDWNIVDRLHLIRPPTFLINGRMDISQDFVVQPFFEKIQKVKWVTLEKSSHMPFFEERERYMQLVGDFLSIM